MQVLFVSHDAYLYGANRSLLTLIEGLRPFGVAPHVLVPERGEFAAALAKREIPFVVAPLVPWMSRSRGGAPIRLARNVALLPRLVRRVREWQIELIYSNSSVTPIGAWTAAAARLPHIWHVRELGSLDYGLRHDWGRGFFAAWLRRSAAVIAISHAVEREVLRRVRDDVDVIWNGVVDREGMETLRSLGETLSRQGPRPAGSYLFVSAGALIPAKGHEDAIRGFAALADDHPGARLLLVGSGSPRYVARLEALAEELGVGERVELAGYLPNPFVVYLKADAILVCSRHEALGRVAQEAMACGKPVVGRRSGGLVEIVKEEETGLLYGGEAAELASCMRRLLEEPTLGRHLGEAGRRRAEQHFLSEDSSRRVFAVIDRALAHLAKPAGTPSPPPTTPPTEPA